MSWLDELEHRLRFECEDKHLTIYVCLGPEIKYEGIECAECGKATTYAGCEPEKVNIIGKVAFEKNGRKAYAISDGRGSVTYMSKTKYDYLDSGGTVTPAYTKDYEKILVENGEGEKLAPVDLTKMKRRPAGGAKEVYSNMLKKRDAPEKGGATS